MEPVIPKWEKESAFDPITALKLRRSAAEYITLDGNPAIQDTIIPSAEQVLSGESDFDLNKLLVRNPHKFVAGQLTNNVSAWENLLSKIDRDDAAVIRSWLTEGVDVEKFFHHYSGSFKGLNLDSCTPPFYYQQNSCSCKGNPNLVARTLEERIKNGSIKLLGRWDQVSDLPVCIMPLTLDVSKSRLCHDERFLNLFVKDQPFKLDTLKEVPRIVNRGDQLIKTDDKSGYDHLLLSHSSRKFFGLTYDGWIMVYRTLPFGFKSACYIYQKLGMVLTSFLREKGILSLQYIDDRLFVIPSPTLTTIRDQGNRLVYAILELITRLGYTLSLHKCSLQPTQTLQFLGFIVDTTNGSFRLPLDKRQAFGELRESILGRKTVDLKSLQKFAGKCASLAIAVPGALFYMRDTTAAISQAIRNSKPVPVTGRLREEIKFWEFLDTWHGESKWRSEGHVGITLATDASQFRWAGVMLDGERKTQTVSDYFHEGDNRPIHLKETEALINVLESIADNLQNKRVRVMTDNKALQYVWVNQGSRNPAFNDLLQKLFQITVKLNIELRLEYVNTKENPADAPSRALTNLDVKLSDQVWEQIQDGFGPHTVDLMSLDSNAMVDADGQPLRHFTPWETPHTAGVDVFAQQIPLEQNPYVFPPKPMVSPVLHFLEEQQVPACTMVILIPVFKPHWWPKILMHQVSRLTLGRRGDKGKLVYPSKRGWTIDELGLSEDLVAFRLSFVSRTITPV